MNIKKKIWFTLKNHIENFTVSTVQEGDETQEEKNCLAKGVFAEISFFFFVIEQPVLELFQ